MDERDGEYAHNVALDVGALALVEAVDDHEAGGAAGRGAALGEGVEEGVDDERVQLCLEGALEHRRVRLHRLRNEAACLRDAQRDLVRDCCHEVFLSVEAGDALGKEERGGEDAALVIQLGDGQRNGRLARAAWAVEPQHAAVALLAQEPCLDHREDGVSRPRLALQRLVLAPRVVEGARCNAPL